MSHVAPALRMWLARGPETRKIGPFQLVEPIGQGGSAPVWLAHETYSGTEIRRAALKLFALGQHSDGQHERLVREAQALCSVDHPHVVRFYALVTDEVGHVEGSSPPGFSPQRIAALAMEYIPGPTLGRRLSAEGPLPPLEVLSLGLAMLAALEAVHRVGLVHRDVKPDNIAEVDGTWKLLDFGIATSEYPIHEANDPDGADPHATARMGVGLAGTPGYVDPFVLQGAPATPASDLYSLGATLYCCLSGHPPAATNTFPRRLDSAIIEGRRSPPPLDRSEHAEFSVFFSIIEQMIAAHPLDRPPSLPWLESRFEAFAQQYSSRVKTIPDESTGPFRGLERFEFADHDIFLGRDGEVAAVLELLRHNTLVALIGPSGSGKSSLARAGILPRLVQGSLGPFPPKWETVVFEPGRDPQSACLTSLKNHVELPDEPSPEELIAALEKHTRKREIGLCLFVDQLEELVTMQQSSQAKARRWLVELLTRMAAEGSDTIRIIIAARRDQLDALLGLPALGPILARALTLVEPLRKETFQRISRTAVSAYGYSFEDEALIDEMLDEIELSEGAMPLVAFALTELWQVRDAETKRLTRNGLASLGGLRGALEKHAESTLTNLTQDNPHKREAARKLLLALTSATGTRIVRTRDELHHMTTTNIDALLDGFVEARLCLPVNDGFTLAHESLIQNWQRLNSWFGEVEYQRRTMDDIERTARAWRKDPENTPLLTPGRLSAVHSLSIRDEHQPWSADAQAYFEASSRTIWRRRGLAGVICLVLLATMVGAANSYLRALRAESQTAQLASARETERARFAEKERRKAEEERENAQLISTHIRDLWEDLQNAKTPDERIERGRQLNAALEKAKRPAPPATSSGTISPTIATSSRGADKPPPEPDDNLIREY